MATTRGMVDCSLWLQVRWQVRVAAVTNMSAASTDNDFKRYTTLV